MTHLRPVALIALAAAALTGMTLAGCSKKKNPIDVGNMRPEVRLTNAPVPDTTQAYFYAYKLNWIGSDPDGRIDHYEYAIDPTNTDTTWVRTVKNEQIFFFRASQPESLGSVQPEGQDFHTFVIVAVDNGGLRSPLVYRSFFSYTVAPTVEITSPRPSRLLEVRVTPVVTIRWAGVDVDGQFTQKPVKYKFKLFKYGEEPRIEQWVQTPDSLRLAFAPNFVGWDSSSAETTFHRYTNLTPDSKYLFVVVAFDEAGAYSPVFSLSTNMLRLNVGFAGQLGPVIAFFNTFFFYRYVSGGFATDESRKVHLDVPAVTDTVNHDTPLIIGWFATPPDENGGEVVGYRWALDNGQTLDDETPRTDEQRDLNHWSQWGAVNILAQLGYYDSHGRIHGFRGNPPGSPEPETHEFYLEAMDVNGFVSLGIIAFRVIRPDWDDVAHGGKGPNGLLIVDDTRLPADVASASRADSIQAPSGDWPNAAELDTFFYARGGVRWRMTPNGTVSRPGVFSSYAYDTLGTRTGKENPTIPLDFLGHYKHVIWYVDGYASQFSPNEIGGSPTDRIYPETTLRYMSSPNRQNTLATYVSQGGNLWLLGGGIGYSTMGEWNQRANDIIVKTFCNSGCTRPDLLPGRFMYDVPHWQSTFKITGGLEPTKVQFKRVDQPEDEYNANNPEFGGNGYPGIPLRKPDAKHPFIAGYPTLPIQMMPKDPAVDPIFPNRTQSDFYSPPYYLDYLTDDNRIEETVQVQGRNGPRDSTFAVLDTLYIAWGKSYQYLNNWRYDQSLKCNPAFTVYHGRDFPNPVIMQGFDLWHFQRPQIVQLVDFVLQSMWGIPPTTNGGAYAPPAGALSARRP